MLALVGNLFYVVVYTGYLKRRGPENIVLGGVAGAVPPLVGYAAATGSIALPALWLFADRVPLDAAALLGARDPSPRALRARRGADAPGRPRRVGDDAADRRLHVVLVARDHRAGRDGNASASLYLVAALLLGGLFLASACGSGGTRRRKGAAGLFHYSLLYLALLFVAAALDPLL